MGIKIERYTSLDAAGADDYFWAINASDEGHQRPKGILIIPVSTEDGVTQNIRLPPSWIPIDLKGFASGKDLLKSTILRTFVSRRLIYLVKKKSVEELLRLPDYIPEFERVRKTIHNGIPLEHTSEVEISTSRSDYSAAVGEILSAEPRDLAFIFNKYRSTLTNDDLRHIVNGAVVGSFSYDIALEWEGVPPSERSAAEQTEAYASAAASGKLSAPTIII